MRLALAITLMGLSAFLSCRRSSAVRPELAGVSQGKEGPETVPLNTILTRAAVAGGRLAQLRFEYISVPADIAAKVGIEPSEEVAVMTRSSDWRELSEAQIMFLGSPPVERGRAKLLWGSRAYILSMSDGRFWYISCDPADVVILESLVPIMGDSYRTGGRIGWDSFTWTGIIDALSESAEQPGDEK